MKRTFQSYYQFWSLLLYGVVMVLWPGIPLAGQSVNTDSLKLELTRDIPDTIRIYALLDLYDELYFVDHNEASGYLDEALELSKQLPDQYFLFEATLAKCRDLIYREEPLDISVPLLMEALELSKSIDYPYGEAAVLYELGDVYNLTNQKDKAFQYFKRGLEITEASQWTEDAIWYYNPLGGIVHEEGDLESAFYYYQRGAEVARLINDNEWLALYYNNMAEIHREQLEFDKAVLIYNQALEVAVTSWDSCLVYANLGQLYTSDSKYELAENNLGTALEMALEYDIREEMCNVYLRWGDYYTSRGFFEKALQEYKRVGYLMKLFAGDISSEYTQFYQLDLLSSMAKVSEAMGLSKEALAYQKEYWAIQDTIFDQEKRSLIQNLSANYKMEQKKVENQLLRAESKVIKTRSQMITYSVVILIIIALLVTWITYKLYKVNLHNKRYADYLEAEVSSRTSDIMAVNIKLEKSNSELESFASITSHDLKEPLRTIAGFSSFLEGNLKQGNYENMTTAVGFIKTNVQRMFRLIEDILAYGQIEDQTGSGVVDFTEIQEHVRESIQTLTLEKEAKIVYRLKNLAPEQLLLPAKLKIVFKNLIENGVKYNVNESPEVVVSYLQNWEGKHVYTFKDNGIGIDEKYREEIFKMFKRLHTKQEYSGTGVGLAICKKIVENLGGELYLKHSDQNGSEFRMEIDPVQN